jgi:2-C-methyl-D-erythritol 4-phosphate cytidylyltransferase
MSRGADEQPLGAMAVVIVAAGRGERFGDAAKVLASAGGRPMLAWSLDAVACVAGVNEVVIVAGEHSEVGIREVIAAGSWPYPVTIVFGGERRHDSVMIGVRAASAAVDLVLIHDAARPLATADLFTACAAAARTYGAAIVAVPVTDTIKRVRDGDIVETIPRSALWAAQTPQGFRRELLIDASERADRRDLDVTDEASLLERLRHPVRIVAGSPTNLKVTHASDLDVADALLRRRTPVTGEAAGR